MTTKITIKARELAPGDFIADDGGVTVLTAAEVREDGRAYFVARDSKGREDTNRMVADWDIEVTR